MVEVSKVQKHRGGRGGQSHVSLLPGKCLNSEKLCDG